MKKRSNSFYKGELEQLSLQNENRNCFDCDKTPAQWASLSNGIYLCLECSGEHRGFGAGVSSIKSITLDQWNETQLSLLRAGGNLKLKKFLQSFEMPLEQDKRSIYSSKLMGYYRRMLKAEACKELFMESVPSPNEYWDEGRNEPNDQSSYTSNLFMKESTCNDRLDNSNSPDMPLNMQLSKSEIIINENHYQDINRYSDLASTFSNKIPTKPKFAQIDPKQQNDPRYRSVSSDPFDYSSSSSSWSYSSYWPGVSSVLGKVWGVSVNVASVIKDKMNENNVGSKLIYVGGKTFEIIAYTGGKLYEKGSEIIQSDTVRSIASRAGSGLLYIKDSIISGVQRRSSSEGSYTLRSSSNSGISNQTSLIDNN